MLTRPGFSARSFFRDPVAFVQSNGEDRSLIRVGAGWNRFILLRDPDAIWRVLVADRESFQPGKWKRKSRRFVGEALIGLDGRGASPTTTTAPADSRPPPNRGLRAVNSVPRGRRTVRLVRWRPHPRLP